MNSQSETPFAYLQTLCAFGPRPVGSAENQAATEFVRAQLAHLGLEVNTQPYPCPYWELGSNGTLLEVNGRQLELRVNHYAPDCDLSVEMVVCGTLPELRAADAAGKLLVLHGSAASQPTIAPYYCYASEPDPMLDLLLEKNPAAVITVESNPMNLFAFIENWEFPIPSASVLSESGRVLLQQPAGMQVRLRIRGQRIESSAANVVAYQKNAQQARRIVLCAHFDTAFGTQGAIDNASGSAVLFASARAFASRSLRHGLEWVAFNGEDSGGVDFTAYAARVSDFENMAVVINIDAVGDWLGSPTITLMGGTPALEALVDGLVADHPALTRVDPWYESDHTMFFFRGVPAIAISSKGYAPVLHSPADTPDWINPRRLAEAAALVIELVERIDRLA